MNKQEREKLRELASAATPGPWRKLTQDEVGMFGITHLSSLIPDEECPSLADLYSFEDAQDEANTDFIAGLNPEVVTALLDYIDELEGVITTLAYGFRARKMPMRKQNDPS